MYKFIVCLFLAVVLALPQASADNLSASNQCLVHLDKSFYLNGEIIWYKIYLPNIVEGRSTMLKVILANESGKTVDYSFLKTEGKTSVSGYYKIPFDCEPGMYSFVVAGIDEATLLPVKLSEFPLPIYNDEEVPKTVSKTEMQNFDNVPQLIVNELKVSVELEQQTIRNRDEVRVRVKVTDEDGRPVVANLSAAVTDWGLCGPETSSLPSLKSGKNLPPPTFYNLKGSMYTKSRLVSELGEPLQANVLGVYYPGNDKMFYTKTDAEGLIFLEIPDFHGSETIQYVGYDNEYEHVKIKPVEELQFAKQSALTYSPGIIEYLNYSRQRKKIFQMYKALEFNLNPEIPAQEAQVLKPNLSINVQEYERFENMATFFTELLTPLRFRIVADTNFVARMYNPRMKRIDKYFPGKPLFIIDGKITRNGNFVGKLKPDYVETVELFYEPTELRRHFNVFGNNGVVRITTSLPELIIPPDEEEDIFDINGLQPLSDFPVFDPAQIGNNRHRPFFRPQLYWNPNLETDGNGEIVFSYFQSDDLSTFRIEVVGQDKEGAIGFGQAVYEVE